MGDKHGDFTVSGTFTNSPVVNHSPETVIEITADLGAAQQDLFAQLVEFTRSHPDIEDADDVIDTINALQDETEKPEKNVGRLKKFWGLLPELVKLSAVGVELGKAIFGG